MKEEWKGIKDFPFYEVSNHGRVRSWKNSQCNKMDKPIFKKLESIGGGWSKYPAVHLSIKSKKYWKTVHSLVLEAFVGPRPDKYEACHNDGDPENNKVDNLRWDTRLNNHYDKIKHGTRLPLVENEVTKTRRQFKISAAKFGELIGVTQTLISRWERGESIPPLKRKKQIQALYKKRKEKAKNYKNKELKEIEEAVRDGSNNRSLSV